METWRVVLGSQKPWILAHCETSGCIRGNFGVLFRGVGVVCALFAFSRFSMCSTFSAFVHSGDFCRGEGTQRSALFKICLHIPLWGGVFAV